MLVCRSCRESKSESQFSLREDSPTGYRNTCKECRVKQSRAYYDAHKDATLKRTKDWRNKNSDRLRKIKREYERTRYKTDPLYLIRRRLRARQNSALRQIGVYRCHKVKDFIGCTLPELRAQFEAQFQPGMSWENYGKWHVDHIRPLVAFDLINESEVKKAFHFSNLQPLWAEENRRKAAKII